MLLWLKSQYYTNSEINKKGKIMYSIYYTILYKLKIKWNINLMRRIRSPPRIPPPPKKRKGLKGGG